MEFHHCLAGFHLQSNSFQASHCFRKTSARSGACAKDWMAAFKKHLKRCKACRLRVFEGPDDFRRPPNKIPKFSPLQFFVALKEYGLVITYQKLDQWIQVFQHFRVSQKKKTSITTNLSENRTCYQDCTSQQDQQEAYTCHRTKVAIQVTISTSRHKKKTWRGWLAWSGRALATTKNKNKNKKSWMVKFYIFNVSIRLSIRRVFDRKSNRGQF